MFLSLTPQAKSTNMISDIKFDDAVAPELFVQ